MIVGILPGVKDERTPKNDPDMELRDNVFTNKLH